MRRSRLWMCALLAIAPSGCKQFNDQFAKVKDQFAKVRATVAAKIEAVRHRRPATGAAPATPPPPPPAVEVVEAGMSAPVTSTVPPCDSRNAISDQICGGDSCAVMRGMIG